MIDVFIQVKALTMPKSTIINNCAVIMILYVVKMNVNCAVGSLKIKRKLSKSFIMQKSRNRMQRKSRNTIEVKSRNKKFMSIMKMNKVKC